MITREDIKKQSLCSIKLLCKDLKDKTVLQNLTLRECQTVLLHRLKKKNCKGPEKYGTPQRVSTFWNALWNMKCHIICVEDMTVRILLWRYRRIRH